MFVSTFVLVKRKRSCSVIASDTGRSRSCVIVQM